MKIKSYIWSALFVTPPLTIALLIAYRTTHQHDTIEQTYRVAFKAKEQRIHLFQEQTKSQWGSKPIQASNSNAVRQFVAGQTISQWKGGSVLLTERQEQAFYKTFADFIYTYSNGSLSNILFFHSRAPYETNFASIDNNFFRKELTLEGIPLPNTQVELLAAYWTLLEHYKYRTDFWQRYKATILKQGKTPNPDDPTAVQEYLGDLKMHGSEYMPLKLTFISSVPIHMAVFSTNTIKGMQRELANVNRRQYIGVQCVDRSIFRHVESPESITSQGRNCTFLVVETAIKVNVTDAFVPVTIVFHWAPDSQTWLPDYFVRHAYGSFRFLF